MPIIWAILAGIASGAIVWELFHDQKPTENRRNRIDEGFPEGLPEVLRHTRISARTTAAGDSDNEHRKTDNPTPGGPNPSPSEADQGGDSGG